MASKFKATLGTAVNQKNGFYFTFFMGNNLAKIKLYGHFKVLEIKSCYFFSYILFKMKPDLD